MIAGLLIGFLLATFAWAILAVLLATHRPPAVTMKGRRNRS